MYQLAGTNKNPEREPRSRPLGEVLKDYLRDSSVFLIPARAPLDPYIGSQ